MKAHVSTLTELQAAEELAALLDAEPDQADVLAHLHWAQESASRIQQLEQHIAYLQSLTTKEMPMAPHKTDPKERLKIALDCYLTWLGKVKEKPGDRSIRKQTSKFATHVRALAKQFQLPCPDLPALPEIPDPKQKGRRGPQKAPRKTVKAVARPLAYRLSSPLTECRSMAPFLEIAHCITRNFWPLCQAIEEMPNREVVRPALDAIHTRLQTAYALLDEPAGEEGA
jgi:hypothetical protein